MCYALDLPERHANYTGHLIWCPEMIIQGNIQLTVAFCTVIKASNIMQNTISEDKNTIRKLEASVTKAYNNVPGSVRTQNQEISQLTERVQTAEATAHAANAVVDKYEREVFMLRAALDIHAHEFQDGSGETVHASLVLALGQVQTYHLASTLCQ